MLWLPIRPLARELPCAIAVALKSSVQNKNKKKKTNKNKKNVQTCIIIESEQTVFSIRHVLSQLLFIKNLKVAVLSKDTSKTTL